MPTSLPTTHNEKNAFGSHYLPVSALLLILICASACTPRAKLILSDISSDARAIDISIWKHIRNKSSDTTEIIPSNPIAVFTIEENTPRYRINVELEHNVEYSIFAATFVPKAGSTTEVCVRDLSPRVELNSLGFLEAVTDVSMPMHPVRNDGIYPSSACIARPSAQGVWPSRKPLVAQLSVSSSSMISDSTGSPPPDMATGMGMPIDMAMGMGMGGSSADMGDGCTGNVGGPTPPPSTVLVDGWLFDPSTKMKLTNASTTSCKPLIDSTVPGQLDAGRLVLPLSSDQVATLRGVRVQLSVTNSSGEEAVLQTAL